MIAQHILDAEFFDGDNAETVDDAPCVLMAEVMATVTNALVNARDNLASLSAFMAPALVLREFALCFGESLLFFAEKARVFEELAIGKGRESLQSNVNADGFLRRRQVFCFNFLAKAGEPLAVDAQNRASLEFAPRLAVEFGFHLPNLGETDGAVSHSDYVRITDLETIALRKSDTVVLAFAFESGEAWGIAILHAVKESLESEVYAVNDILQDLTVDGFEFGVALLPLRQVGLLSVAPDGDVCGVVLELPVIDQAIVDESAGFKRLF